MLSMDDQWAPSERELLHVKKDERMAFQSLKGSEWAAAQLADPDEIVNPNVAEAKAMRDGKLKRKYVMDELCSRQWHA
jgi:hypothetical protein